MTCLLGLQGALMCILATMIAAVLPILAFIFVSQAVPMPCYFQICAFWPGADQAKFTPKSLVCRYGMKMTGHALRHTRTGALLVLQACW